MKRIADKLFGDHYHWSVLAAGRHQTCLRQHGCDHGRQRPRRPRGFDLCRQRQLAKSNAEQVTRIPHHPGGALAGGRDAEGGAAPMLSLKGGDQVAF
jgi:uncharacterized protein (DUF849 family)